MSSASSGISFSLINSFAEDIISPPKVTLLNFPLRIVFVIFRGIADAFMSISSDYRQKKWETLSNLRTANSQSSSVKTAQKVEETKKQNPSLSQSGVSQSGVSQSDVKVDAPNKAKENVQTNLYEERHKILAKELKEFVNEIFDEEMIESLSESGKSKLSLIKVALELASKEPKVRLYVRQACDSLNELSFAVIGAKQKEILEQIQKKTLETESIIEMLFKLKDGSKDPLVLMQGDLNEIFSDLKKYETHFKGDDSFEVMMKIPTFFQRSNRLKYKKDITIKALEYIKNNVLNSNGKLGSLMSPEARKNIQEKVLRVNYLLQLI